MHESSIQNEDIKSGNKPDNSNQRNVQKNNFYSRLNAAFNNNNNKDNIENINDGGVLTMRGQLPNPTGHSPNHE